MTSKELLKRKRSFLFITRPTPVLGKLTSSRNAISLKPKWGILSATTGAASRVLSGSTEDDVKTINSTLGFFNAESLVAAEIADTPQNSSGSRELISGLSSMNVQCSMLRSLRFYV